MKTSVFSGSCERIELGIQSAVKRKESQILEWTWSICWSKQTGIDKQEGCEKRNHSLK